MTTALRTRRRAKRPAPRAPVEIVVARTPDEVDRLESRWRALDRRGACPASHFGWSRACLGAFAEGAAVEFIAVTRGGELVAAAPLLGKRVRGVPRVAVAGFDELREPLELVWTDETALAQLAGAMARGGSPLVLGRLPAESPVVGALARACRGRAAVVVREERPYAYIRLDESWVEPQQHLNTIGRSLLRGDRLKAERFGRVATEIHSPGLHELPELLDEAVEIAAGAKGPAAGMVANDPHRAVFLRQYAQSACVDGCLRICFLRIGDQVAAAQLAIESGCGFWLLLAGELDRYAACSPGRLLLRETIRYAAEADLKWYEFWGGTEPWTPAWTTHSRRCVSVRIYPYGVRGLTALAADAAVAGWHKSRRLIERGKSVDASGVLGAE